MLLYLRRLPPGKTVLWCYLIWYLSIVAFHFDPSPRLWATSVGIAAIVGTALYLSVSPPPGVRREGWQTARLFMMPFFVSSYSSLIKDQGFVLIFPPSLAENLTAAGLCALFVLGVAGLKRGSGTEERRNQPPDPPSPPGPR